MTAPSPTPEPTPAPEPSPTPAPSSFSDLVSGLPEELRESSPFLKDTKDFAGLVQRTRDTMRLVGQDKVPVPKADDLSSVERYLKAGGWQGADPSQYDFEDIDPEDAQSVLDPKATMQMVKAMAENGINPTQAKALLAAQVSISKARLAELVPSAAEIEAKQQERMAALRQEFPEDFERRKEMADRLVSQIAGGDEKLLQEFRTVAGGDGMPLLDHPAVAKLLLSLGKLAHEGGALPGQQQLGGLSVGQVREKIVDVEIKLASSTLAEGERDKLNRERKELIKALGDEPLEAERG